MTNLKWEKNGKLGGTINKTDSTYRKHIVLY